MAHKKVPIHQMNVVPYIDVMLVLLVIFMVTAPMVQTTTIELPKSDAPATVSPATPPIRIELTDTKTYLLSTPDGQITPIPTADALSAALGAQAKSRSEPLIVYLAASPHLPYGEVIDEIDRLRKVGGIKVSLLMQKK